VKAATREEVAADAPDNEMDSTIRADNPSELDVTRGGPKA
jgi:hypothetical protein